jgi:hypothetical protein
VKNNFILADPSLFRRSASTTKLIGKSVSELFFEADSSIIMARGNSDIENGIVKVRSYIAPREYHVHPIDSSPNAPYLYVSSELDYVASEFTGYYWKTDTSGNRIDEPAGKDDHALDTIKYMLSRAPEPGRIDLDAGQKMFYLDNWSERESTVDHNRYRH